MVTMSWGSLAILVGGFSGVSAGLGVFACMAKCVKPNKPPRF